MPPNISAMINVTDIFLFFVGTTRIKRSLKGRPKRSAGFRANLPRLLKLARAHAALSLLYLITDDAVYADVFICTYAVDARIMRFTSPRICAYGKRDFFPLVRNYDDAESESYIRKLHKYRTIFDTEKAHIMAPLFHCHRSEVLLFKETELNLQIYSWRHGIVPLALSLDYQFIGEFQLYLPYALNWILSRSSPFLNRHSN